jgi:hypothetical protein
MLHSFFCFLIPSFFRAINTARCHHFLRFSYPVQRSAFLSKPNWQRRVLFSKTSFPLSMFVFPPCSTRGLRWFNLLLNISKKQKSVEWNFQAVNSFKVRYNGCGLEKEARDALHSPFCFTLQN